MRRVIAWGWVTTLGLVVMIGCGNDSGSGGGSGGSNTGGAGSGDAGATASGGSSTNFAANCAQRANSADFCDATSNEHYAWDCDASPGPACLDSGAAGVWCCPHACAPLDAEVNGWHCTDAATANPWGCYEPETNIQTPSGCTASDMVEIICCPDGAGY